MLKSKGVLVATLLGTCLVVMSKPSQAQTSKQEQTQDGYFYEFMDSDLVGELLDANMALIHVRGGPARALLLRPRGSFVPELCKSVENI